MAVTSTNLADDDPLLPIAVLIDELRHDDVTLRKNAVTHLKSIAGALGPCRTREELIPFLAAEVIDDEDDVQKCLCEQLSDLIPYVGGSIYAHALIYPLEELANTEKAIVRDKVSYDIESELGKCSEGLLSRVYSGKLSFRKISGTTIILRDSHTFSPIMLLISGNRGAAQDRPRDATGPGHTELLDPSRQTLEVGGVDTYQVGS